MLLSKKEEVSVILYKMNKVLFNALLEYGSASGLIYMGGKPWIFF